MTHARFFLTAGALGAQLLCTAASAQAADAAQARTLSDVTVKADPDRPGCPGRFGCVGAKAPGPRARRHQPGAPPQDEARLATLKDAWATSPGWSFRSFSVPPTSLA